VWNLPVDAELIAGPSRDLRSTRRFPNQFGRSNVGAIERWLAQTGQVPQAATRTPDNTAIPAGLPSGGLVGSAISGGASFDEILRTSFRPSTVNSVSSNSPSSNFDGGQRDSRARADRVDAGRTARDPGNRSSRDRVSLDRTSPEKWMRLTLADATMSAKTM
jgi:hypothetical protein